MLVLTRKAMEQLVVNDNIEITVLSIDDNKVILGFTAPREIPILCKGLYLRGKKEKQPEAEPAG